MSGKYLTAETNTKEIFVTLEKHIQDLFTQSSFPSHFYAYVSCDFLSFSEIEF